MNEIEYKEVNVFLPKNLSDEMRIHWESKFGKKGRTKFIQEVLDNFLNSEVVCFLTSSPYIDPSSEQIFIALDWLDHGVNQGGEGTSSKIKLTKSSISKVNDLIKSLKKSPIQKKPKTLNKACVIRSSIEIALAKAM